MDAAAVIWTCAPVRGKCPRGGAQEFMGCLPLLLRLLSASLSSGSTYLVEITSCLPVQEMLWSLYSSTVFNLLF